MSISHEDQPVIGAGLLRRPIAIIEWGCNSWKGIAEHYINPTIPLKGVILDPSLDLTA